VLKRAPSAVFFVLFYAAVMPAISAIFPCVGLAQSFASFGAQSGGGDPNRPPTAQHTPPRNQHTPISSTERPSADAPAGDEEILFEHVNESRVLAGLAALQWDANLAAAARQHCVLLVQHEALSHQFPEEDGLKERLRHTGAEFSVAAENIAMAATPDELHYEWMHSPPHRANILDPDLNAIGIAELPGRKGLYAVQDFARAVEKMSFPEQEERVRLLISAAGVHTADNPERTQWSDARATCGMKDGYAGKPAEVVRFETSDLSQLPAKLKTSLASGRYHSAAVGACQPRNSGDGFAVFRVAVLLY
jgi:uncharacterized protein YkwD